MLWKPKERLYDWRKHLTAQEKVIINASDLARGKIRELTLAYNEKFQRDRMIIVNRAIHRAKYEMEKS